MFFENYLNNQILFVEQLIDEDPFFTIKIFGELLSKGWIRKLYPLLIKKSH